MVWKRLVVGAVLGAITVVGIGRTAGTGWAGAATTADRGLGTRHPATGSTVKVGFITDDKWAANDNSIETPVAEATVKWLNEYLHGVGGHKIELVRCVDQADPSKATDCANQMVAEKVAAVVIGGNQVIQNAWEPIHAAGIPMFVTVASNPDMVNDSQSTFILVNGRANLFSLPVGVAKATKAKKITVVSVDLPAATDFYTGPGPALFKQHGLALDLVPVAIDTADMTPQMQRVVAANPNGVVLVLGGDAFCIAAFNGLRAAGFKGTVTAVPFCITDATRTAVPGDFLKGIRITSTAPNDDPGDPSMKQYAKVLKKYGASDIDTTKLNGIAMFTALSALSIATQRLDGEATPEAVIAAAKAMPWSVLPGTGGTHFRCNGKADPTTPAVCANAALAATLDARGKAASYTPVGDGRIPD